MTCGSNHDKAKQTGGVGNQVRGGNLVTKNRVRSWKQYASISKKRKEEGGTSHHDPEDQRLLEIKRGECHSLGRLLEKSWPEGKTTVVH